MHSDFAPYFRLTSRSRLEKEMSTLRGMLKGISADSIINDQEFNFLEAWLEDHDAIQNSHPYNEIFEPIRTALQDRILAEEEKEDLLWLCDRLSSKSFYDQTTIRLQELHGILGGLVADAVISSAELQALREWLDANEDLRTRWPYDEIDSLVSSVLSDGEISEEEHRMLLDFFAEFVEVLDDKTISKGILIENESVKGVCATCPEVQFVGSTFCLTGASSKYQRKEFEDKITQLGGEIVKTVCKRLNYLVIGGDGNPCWAYACYGRKVEKAIELRKEGYQLLIIHEFDVHDAIEDAMAD